MKTPEEIAEQALRSYNEQHGLTLAQEIGNFGVPRRVQEMIVAAVEADRAQHVGVYVPATVHSPDTLFFREVWINGQGDDGTTLELTRTVGGGALVLEIDKPDGARIVESINASEFTRAWAAAAKARA